MSVQVAVLDASITNEPLTMAQQILILKVAATHTVAAYHEKEDQQIELPLAVGRALAAARKRKIKLPYRNVHDEPSMYDEAIEVVTHIGYEPVNEFQMFGPIIVVKKHWPIPDLERWLYLAEDGTFSGIAPSVIAKDLTLRQLPFNHPLVLDQFDDIMRGLDAMRLALREV